MMQRRSHTREPVALAVKLVQKGHVIATAQAIDVSQDGVGIECPDVALEAGQRVDIDFYKPGYPRGISCWVPAMVVVHSGPKCVGLVSPHESGLKMVSPRDCVESRVHGD